MVSIWWLVAAFVLGGSGGILLMALLQMAGGLPEQSQYVPDLNSTPW